MWKDIPTLIPEAAVEDVDILSDFMKTEIEMICHLNSIPFWLEFHRNFVGKEKENVTFEKFCSLVSSLIQHEEENKVTFLIYAVKLASE
ncbi:hypothetical protein TNCT_403001 [Trichonephila clavata]|uniref:Uncharacterized protein n=1 Tax=Trichonephila clavata TaxID=2740835 RepID=A0A8X6FDA3_TRICU|nr:hypothetical protein TNCT_403001 [Trichonephila clavata]